MEGNTGTVILRCECNCAMLVIDKYEIGDNTDYAVSMQSSIFDGVGKLKNRIKMAWKILIGKEVSFRDLYIENEKDMIEFRDELTELIAKTQKITRGKRGNCLYDDAALDQNGNKLKDWVVINDEQVKPI